MELIGIVLLVVGLVGGLAAHYISGKIDSPAEQAAEALLKTKGVDVDFSADAKKEQAAKDPKN